MIGYDQIDGASARNPQLRALLKRLIDQSNLQANTLGVDSTAGQQTTRQQRRAPPGLAQMEVLGDDGNFYITITNPQDLDGVAVHTVQSSSTLPFTTSLDLVTYGPSPATSRTVNDPGKSYYWRWRSQYQNSEPNRWQQLPEAVSSGAVRSRSLVTVNNRQTISPSPLVQSGTSKTISVLAFTMRIGDLSVSYNAGSVLAATYDNYYVYFSDPNKLGGAVTFLATTDPQVAVSGEGNVVIGSISLSGDGGGMGADFTRPFQSCCVVGTTLITLSSGATKLASAVVVGDSLLGVDDAADLVSRVESFLSRPCWIVTTQTGKVLQAASHHLLYGGQGSAPVPVGMVNIGDPVLVRVASENQVDFVVTKSLLGPQTVYRIITTRTKSYLADGVWSRDFGGSTLA